MQGKNGKNHKRKDRQHPAHLFPDTSIMIPDNGKERRRLRYENARLFKNHEKWTAIDPIALIEELERDGETRQNTFPRKRLQESIHLR